VSVRSVLWCDGPGCAAIGDGFTRGQGYWGEVLRLRRDEAGRGWIRLKLPGAKDYEDFCPACAAAIRMQWQEVHA
jgi:hypothetical protein